MSAGTRAGLSARGPWPPYAASRRMRSAAFARELAAAPRRPRCMADRTCTQSTGRSPPGRWTCSNALTGKPRSSGRRPCSPRAAAARPPTPSARLAAAPALASAAGPAALRGLNEILNGELRSLPGGGDRHTARRGPDPGRCSRSPGKPTAVHAELGPPDARVRVARVHGLSLDIYVNETTRHADFILPAPSPLPAQPLRPRVSTVLRSATIANYSPPVFEPDGANAARVGRRSYATGIVTGQAPVHRRSAALDGMRCSDAPLQRELSMPESPLAGRDPTELLEEFSVPPAPGPPARPDAARGAVRADARPTSRTKPHWHRPRPASSRASR